MSAYMMSYMMSYTKIYFAYMHSYMAVGIWYMYAIYMQHICGIYVACKQAYMIILLDTCCHICHVWQHICIHICDIYVNIHKPYTHCHICLIYDSVAYMSPYMWHMIFLYNAYMRHTLNMYASYMGFGDSWTGNPWTGDSWADTVLHCVRFVVCPCFRYHRK